jgi:protein TIF31
MCQVLHLKIAVRDYDFESSSPFQLTDIVDLLPNLKSCEPDSPYPATKELFAHANQFLKENNLQAAESCIHEAAQYLSVVTGGTIHKETVTAFDSLSTIYEYSEDIAAASEFASRALLLSVQATGLDSSETYRYHVKLGAYFAEMKNYEFAVKHLLTAKYLLELIGTKAHPESGIILLRLADIYQSFDDAPTALECLNEAATRIMDYTKLGIIYSSTAQLYSDLGDYELAHSQAKTCHSLNLQIFGESHERTTEAKLLADKYKRAHIDYKVRLAKEERLRKQTAEEEKLVASFETDNKNVNNVKKGKQRK